MNWLTHILLSKKDIEYQLGNILADPFKGNLWTGASQSLQDGVAMHKAIDRYTDKHPTVYTCKKRLGERAYLKGVVVDLLYDHYLSRNWDSYASISMETFLDQFHSSAIIAAENYPKKQQNFVNSVVRSKMLGSYASFEGFVFSLHKIENRLSPRLKKKDSALRYVSIIKRQYTTMENDFNLFFPELINFFKNHDLGSQTNSHLI